MSDAVWHLLNDDRCYQTLFFEYFENYQAENAAQQTKNNLSTLLLLYCNWCNFFLQYITSLFSQSENALKKSRNSLLAITTAQLLTEWAEYQLKALYSNVWWLSCLQIFMSEFILTEVMKNIDSIIIIEKLKNVAQTWELWDTYD